MINKVVTPELHAPSGVERLVDTWRELGAAVTCGTDDPRTAAGGFGDTLRDLAG